MSTASANFCDMKVVQPAAPATGYRPPTFNMVTFGAQREQAACHWEPLSCVAPGASYGDRQARRP